MWGISRPIQFGGTTFVSTEQLNKVGGLDNPDVYGLSMSMDEYGTGQKWTYFNSGQGVRKVDERLMTFLEASGIETLYTPDAIEIEDSVDDFVAHNRANLLTIADYRETLVQSVIARIKEFLAFSSV
jgi:hypothetical protein